MRQREQAEGDGTAMHHRDCSAGFLSQHARARERDTCQHESQICTMYTSMYYIHGYGARHDPKRTPSSTARRPSSSIARTCSAPHSFICTTPAGEARRKKSSVREKVVRMRSSSR